PIGDAEAALAQDSNDLVPADHVTRPQGDEAHLRRVSPRRAGSVCHVPRGPESGMREAQRQRASRAALFFRDVPPYRHGTGKPARDAVLAVGAERLVLAEHGIVAAVHDAVGHGERDLLLLLRIAFAGERRPELLHLRIARPAEPGLVA